MVVCLPVINLMHFIPILKMRKPSVREAEPRFKPRQCDSKPACSPSAPPWGKVDNGDAEETPDLVLFSGSL